MFEAGTFIEAILPFMPRWTLYTWTRPRRGEAMLEEPDFTPRCAILGYCHAVHVWVLKPLGVL